MRVDLLWVTPQAEKNVLKVARISSDQSNEKPGLIKYLLNHKHFSPFEHSFLSVQIRTSRAIAAQLLRHRSFVFQELCVDGDTKIRLIQPNGAPYLRTIKHLFSLQEQGRDLPQARVYDGEKFVSSRIKEVFKTGIKPVFKIKTGTGKEIITTKEHQFLTKEGFVSLEKACGLDTSKNLATMSKKCFIATNGIPVYRSYDWMKEAKEEAIRNKTGVAGIAQKAGCAYPTIRKWLKIHDLKFTKREVASYTPIWNKGKFGYKLGPHSLETIKKFRKSARRGSASNLWRGGAQRSERLKIADWCATIRAEKFLEYNFKCAKCKSNLKLELDHIQPVYSHPELAYKKTNIQVLCHSCHVIKHGTKTERKTWREKSKGNTLTIRWEKIESIEYIGERETYDLHIEGDYHNYIANSFIVHNSTRYTTPDSSIIYGARRQAEKNRQSSVDDLPEETKEWFREAQEIVEQECKKLYDGALEAGIARESARFLLPLGTGTQLVMTGSIRSWLHYLELRTQEDTQLEHREIAEEIKTIFTENFPIISEALGWV